MRFTLFSTLFTLFVAVMACEETCMNGTVGEVMRRFGPVLEDLFVQKEQQLGVPQCLDPLRDAFQSSCPAVIHQRVFSHFRGKCQRKGVEPEGCPIPDCSVRCGTPGSMVHFYWRFRRLAFISIRDWLRNNTASDSLTFQNIQERVEHHPSANAIDFPMPKRFVPRTYANREMSLPILYMREPFDFLPGLSGLYNYQSQTQRTRDSSSLAAALKPLVTDFEHACGLEPEESSTDLMRCSWTKSMQDFILQYP